MVRFKALPDIDLDDWHYRVICKLCGFHKPIDHKPIKHDFGILVCHTCYQSYRDEWVYGIYKLVECSKWYSPFKKYKWINKEIEEENEHNQNTKTKTCSP